MFMFRSNTNRTALTGTLLGIVCIASGCSAIDRLSQIGEQPKLTAVDNPTTQPGYKPVQMPMPKPETASYNANSLWRNGSRAFFKDQRAARIGDILTVTVNITDKANIANETQRSRVSKEDSGVTDFIGSKLLTGKAAAAPMSDSVEDMGYGMGSTSTDYAARWQAKDNLRRHTIEQGMSTFTREFLPDFGKGNE